MKMNMTGNQFMQNPRRVAGTYQIAYDVTTPSGKTGTVLFVYEYDKRDVMEELVMATPEIADEMREYIGEDSPCCHGPFRFPGKEEENTNGEKVTEAIREATVQVYGYDG